MSDDPRVKGAAFDIHGTQDLRRSIADKSPEGVKEAAKQFESLLTHSMIKSMRSTIPKNGLFSSHAEEMYTSLYDQQLADDIAHSSNGGLGLAKVIEQQLGRQMGVDMNPKATNNQNQNQIQNQIQNQSQNQNQIDNLTNTLNANPNQQNNQTPTQTPSLQLQNASLSPLVIPNEQNQQQNSIQQNSPNLPQNLPNEQNQPKLATIVRAVNKQAEFQNAYDNVNNPNSVTKNKNANLVENVSNEVDDAIKEIDDKTQDDMMRSLVIKAISGLISGEINFNEFKQNINQINGNKTALIDNDQQFVHLLNLSAVNNNVNFEPSNDDLYNASAATLLAAIEMQQQIQQQNQQLHQQQQQLQQQQLLQNANAVQNHLNLPMANSNLRHIPVSSKTTTSATYARMGVFPSAKTQKSLQRVTENIDLSSLTNLSDTAKNFVRSVWNDAQKASQTTGIDANYLIAHAALESGWGQSQPGGRDNPSYNLFGIKANKGWDGRSVAALTTEYIDGIAVKKIERFRAYNSYAEGFEDYAKFLKENPRYAKVLQATSGNEFAQNLQKAGYATDPAYANKLTNIMRDTNLDNKNLSPNSTARKKS